MKDRMTQQVEELQWKIRNKTEPPTKLVTTKAVVERPNSLVTANGNHGIRSKDWSRSGGNENPNGSFKSVCRSLFFATVTNIKKDALFQEVR